MKQPTTVSPFFLVVLGNLFYLFSEVTLKYFSPDSDIYLVSAMRFFCGALLFPLADYRMFMSLPVIGFALANIVNSMVGYGAMLNGSYQGFSIAQLFRPAFIALISVSFFKERASAIDIIVIFGCISISLLIGRFDGSVFNLWIVLFLLTGVLQAFTNAGIGNTSIKLRTMDYIVGYNILGFAVAAIAYMIFGSGMHGLASALSVRQALPLIVSGLFGLLGSIVIVQALQATGKARSISGTYIRFPLSMFLASLLFGESVSIFTIVGSVAIMILVSLNELIDLFARRSPQVLESSP